jgi:hypothetical protein
MLRCNIFLAIELFFNALVINDIRTLVFARDQVSAPAIGLEAKGRKLSNAPKERRRGALLQAWVFAALHPNNLDKSFRAHAIGQ